MWKIWQTLFADISSSRYLLEMLEFFQSPFFYFFHCIILLSTHPRLDMEPETFVFGFMLNLWCTLPETNKAPENGPSLKETSIPTIHFQVLC